MTVATLGTVPIHLKILETLKMYTYTTLTDQTEHGSVCFPHTGNFSKGIFIQASFSMGSALKGNNFMFSEKIPPLMNTSCFERASLSMAANKKSQNVSAFVKMAEKNDVYSNTRKEIIRF